MRFKDDVNTPVTRADDGERCKPEASKALSVPFKRRLQQQDSTDSYEYIDEDEMGESGSLRMR